MTHLFNDAASFTNRTVGGFVVAHPRWVQSRARGSQPHAHTACGPGRKMIIGGGSSHYRALLNFVDQVCSAGAMGDIFASPSAAQVSLPWPGHHHGGDAARLRRLPYSDFLNFCKRRSNSRRRRCVPLCSGHQ